MLFKSVALFESCGAPPQLPSFSDLTFAVGSDCRRGSSQFASISGAVSLGAAHTSGRIIVTPSASLVGDIAAADIGSEHYKIHRIIGDGKCMFRATVRALAINKGVFLTPADEREEAEKLRVACHDALCRTSHRRRQFPDAEKQIRFGYGDIEDYCAQLAKPSFWGGEVEMMVIAKMLQVPIFVYQSDVEKRGYGTGFSIIIKFGERFAKVKNSDKRRRPVRLLYSGGNHYDLLV